MTPPQASKNSRLNGWTYTMFRDIVTIIVVPLITIILGLLWCHEIRLTKVEIQTNEIPPPEVKQALLRIDQRLENIEAKLYE